MADPATVLRRAVPVGVVVLLIVLALVRVDRAGRGSPQSLHPAPDYASALAEAGRTGKPVLLDFYADWCGPCRDMDRVTLRDDEVVDLIHDRLVAVRIDTGSAPGSELARIYHVEAYPTFVIADAAGPELARITGYRSPRAFLAALHRALPDPTD